MISFTTKEQEKIDLLDDILSSSSPEQLKRLTEELKIVSELSGTNSTHYVFKQIVNDHNRLVQRVLDLEIQITNLQSTLDTVCKALIDSARPTVNTNLDQLRIKTGYY